MESLKICNLHNKTTIINEEPFYKERNLFHLYIFDIERNIHFHFKIKLKILLSL
jgi:hypothetical protein